MDIFANTRCNSLFRLCSGSASLPDVDYLTSRIQGVVDGRQMRAPALHSPWPNQPEQGSRRSLDTDWPRGLASLRLIEPDFGPEHAETFRRDLHPDLCADYVLANPPFNNADWLRQDDDVRWQPSGARQVAKGNPQGERGGVHQFDVPPKGNANFASV